MTLENYLAIGLMGLLLSGLVFVVVWLIYDWCDTRKLRAQLKCRQEGYERGYQTGRADGRAEVQAEWDEAEEKRKAEEAKRKIEEDIRKAEEEKKRKAEEEKKKRKGAWQGNDYYMHDPIEIVHTYGEFVTLCADQTFSEDELEHIGYDKAKVLLTYKLLAEAAPYVDFCEEFNPMLHGKTVRARLRVVKVNR